MRKQSKREKEKGRMGRREESLNMDTREERFTEKREGRERKGGGRETAESSGWRAFPQLHQPTQQTGNRYSRTLCSSPEKQPDCAPKVNS